MTKIDTASLVATLGSLFLAACSEPAPTSQQGSFEVKLLVGSALHEFCDEAAAEFNRQEPQLESGETFYISCEAKGSGDVVGDVISLAEQLKTGSLQPDDPRFPTLISVDGEIYQEQLRYQMTGLFPGQDYIPAVTDAPLLAHSPMVFMVPSKLAELFRKQPDIYQTLVAAETYQDLDPNQSPLPIHFVHTAPTRSNSGLQTLVAQFTSVSGGRPEQLTVADVQKLQPQVREIQSKVTRYGTSTSSLAKDMVKNGIFWASIASVYESSVIAANSNNDGPDRYEAIYPPSTFTSNMRAIVPDAPWVSDREKAAAEQIVEYLRSPEVQSIATRLGLRPGVPGVELGPKFSPQLGVDPDVKYDSLRSPRPEVVEAMLDSWQKFAKKPSQVVILVDSSGSMSGEKIVAVQNTLNSYIEQLGPKDSIALIDFDSTISPPVTVDGTPEGRDRGIRFIANLKADGGTQLYDATLQPPSSLPPP